MSALILGDNVFYGSERLKLAFGEFKSGASVFGYHVNDPRRYGVVEFDAADKAISIQEKPEEPREQLRGSPACIYSITKWWTSPAS